MKKLIFLFVFFWGCTNNEKVPEKSLNFIREQVDSSDTILGSIAGTFDKIQLIQFHVYHNGFICGYINCIVKYEDIALKKLSSISISDINDTKGLIGNVELIRDECDYTLNVPVGRNFHSLSFVYENCNRILLDSTDEVSIESLSKRNSGIRVAKGEPPFIQVVYK